MRDERDKQDEERRQEQEQRPPERPPLPTDDLPGKGGSFEKI